MIFEHGKQNATDSKAIARHEISCTLRDIISATDYLLKTHGTFFLIHRPFRLPEIFTTLKEFRLEPKKMQLVYQIWFLLRQQKTQIPVFRTKSH